MDYPNLRPQTVSDSPGSRFVGLEAVSIRRIFAAYPPADLQLAGLAPLGLR